MILIGIALLLIGWGFGIYLLWILGLIALVIGVVMLIVGLTGREVGGRRYWY